MKDELTKIGVQIIEEAFDKYFMFNHNEAIFSVTQKGYDKKSSWELARMQDGGTVLPIKHTTPQGVINYLATT